MAKVPSSVLGIDLGRYSFKAVHLVRKSGNRYALQNYAVRLVDGAVQSPDAMANHLKELLKEVGGKPPRRS